MNARQRRKYAAIFARPTSGSVRWADLEKLLLALGCEVVEGDGSRVRFVHTATKSVATFHWPHPAKEAKKYQVEDARRFLELIRTRP